MRWWVVLAATAAIGFSYPASAQTLQDKLRDLVERHNKARAARHDLTAEQNRVQEAWGGWFPTATAKGSYGYENDKKPDASDTSMPPRQADLTVNQLLWDFGATSATIRRVKTGEDQAKHALDQVRQQLLLEGSTAYLNLLRTSEVLGFARQSEENIRKQTGLEEARVQRGSGLTTDVLQAKTQLAGAQARRSRAEGALEVARNRYSTVFGETPASLAGPRPTISFDRAPGNLDDAVKLALDNNPQLKAAQAGAMGARENVKATQAKAFAPRLDGKASATYKHDVDGTMNKERSLLYKVELSFPFNLAFTAINTLEIAKSGLSATEARVADARNTVEEQVRNAWQNLRSARETADFLRNQATIAGEFLELARRERQLGTRSLIDILNGETALINANADAASAETDVLIGQLSLLAAMGQLDFAAIR